MQRLLTRVQKMHSSVAHAHQKDLCVCLTKASKHIYIYIYMYVQEVHVCAIIVFVKINGTCMHEYTKSLNVEHIVKLRVIYALSFLPFPFISLHAFLLFSSPLSFWCASRILYVFMYIFSFGTIVSLYFYFFLSETTIM